MYFTFHVYYLYFDLNNFCILNIGTPETACYHVYNLHKPHAWPPPVRGDTDELSTSDQNPLHFS